MNRRKNYIPSICCCIRNIERFTHVDHDISLPASKVRGQEHFSFRIHVESDVEEAPASATIIKLAEFSEAWRPAATRCRSCHLLVLVFLVG